MLGQSPTLRPIIPEVAVYRMMSPSLPPDDVQVGAEASRTAMDRHNWNTLRHWRNSSHLNMFGAWYFWDLLGTGKFFSLSVYLSVVFPSATRCLLGPRNCCQKKCLRDLLEDLTQFLPPPDPPGFQIVPTKIWQVQSSLGAHTAIGPQVFASTSITLTVSPR